MPQKIEMMSGWGSAEKMAALASRPASLPARSGVVQAADQSRLADLTKAMSALLERQHLDQVSLAAAHAELEQLRARNTELERQLQELAQPLETGGHEGSKPAPGALQSVSVSDVVQAAAKAEGQPAPGEPSKSEMDELTAYAQKLGITVDGRWGYKTLVNKIAEAEQRIIEGHEKGLKA